MGFNPVKISLKDDRLLTKVFEVNALPFPSSPMTLILSPSHKHTNILVYYP